MEPKFLIQSIAEVSVIITIAALLIRYSSRLYEQATQDTTNHNSRPVIITGLYFLRNFIKREGKKAMITTKKLQEIYRRKRAELQAYREARSLEDATAGTMDLDRITYRVPLGQKPTRDIAGIVLGILGLGAMLAVIVIGALILLG